MGSMIVSAAPLDSNGGANESHLENLDPPSNKNPQSDLLSKEVIPVKQLALYRNRSLQDR